MNNRIEIQGADDQALAETNTAQASTLAGTPYFMSPEAISQQAAGRRSDVWSFGGFVLQMATGCVRWQPFQSALLYIYI